MTEKTRILGDDEVDSASTGRLVAQETRIVKHSQTEADKPAASRLHLLSLHPSPTRIPIHERNCIDIEPNGRRLGYRQASAVNVRPCVCCASRWHGERRLHHRGPRRFPVQGLCTCPLRIARCSLLRTLPSPNFQRDFSPTFPLQVATCSMEQTRLTTLLTSARSKRPCIARHSKSWTCSVLVSHLGVLLCALFHGRDKTTVDRLSWPERVELRNNFLRGRSPLHTSTWKSHVLHDRVLTCWYHRGPLFLATSGWTLLAFPLSSWTTLTGWPSSLVEDVEVHLHVTPDRAQVVTACLGLKDRRQAVELEPDQYSTKMWSCFLDVTPVLAPVMRVETLNKIYKLLNISPGQRSHEGLRHQGHPDDIVPLGKSNSVKQRSIVEYVLEWFVNHVCRRKSRRAQPLGAQLEIVFFWCCCTLKGGLIFSASVHRWWHRTGHRPSAQQHACAGVRFKFHALRCAEWYRYFAHPPGTRQDPGVLLRCVLRALRCGTPEQHQLGHRQAPGQHPFAGVHVFLQKFRCGELGPGAHQDACRHVRFDLRDFPSCWARPADITLRIGKTPNRFPRIVSAWSFESLVWWAQQTTPWTSARGPAWCLWMLDVVADSRVAWGILWARLASPGTSARRTTWCPLFDVVHAADITFVIGQAPAGSPRVCSHRWNEPGWHHIGRWPGCHSRPFDAASFLIWGSQHATCLTSVRCPHRCPFHLPTFEAHRLSSLGRSSLWISARRSARCTCIRLLRVDSAPTLVNRDGITVGINPAFSKIIAHLFSSSCRSFDVVKPTQRHLDSPAARESSPRCRSGRFVGSPTDPTDVNLDHGPCAQQDAGASVCFEWRVSRKARFCFMTRPARRSACVDLQGSRATGCREGTLQRMEKSLRLAGPSSGAQSPQMSDACYQVRRVRADLFFLM